MTKRRYLILGIVAILICALYFWASSFYEARVSKEAPEPEKTAEEIREGKLISGNFDGDEKIVFLTFDDGPTYLSDEILDILKENDVKATFFPNARDVTDYDYIYDRIINEGHTLGNHTFSHEYYIYDDPTVLLEDIEALRQRQVQAIGEEPPKIFRFPGGSLTASQEDIDAVYQNGFNYIDWNVQCGDGIDDDIPTETVVEKIIDGVHKQNISIVLLHPENPNKESSREALDTIIKTLKQEGYTFLPIKENYTLPRFAQPTGVNLPTIPDPGLQESQEQETQENQQTVPEVEEDIYFEQDY